MKKCSYCGREYADDTTVCPIDQEPLLNVVGGRVEPTERGKVSGLWRGAYGYENKGALGEKVIPFTLTLKQGWLGHFAGTVTEDTPMGMPGIGKVDGFFEWPTIEFTKQMPIGYIARPDGGMRTFREYFIEHGHVCENELPSPPVSCEGTFLDGNRVQGFWFIKPTRVSLPDGWGITVPQTTGLWCAEYITADIRAKPTTGPQQPFFDKSLLPEPEFLAEANSAFHSLGKFPVADAETLLKRFERENIRFEVARDDSAIRQMLPVTAIFGGYSGTAPMIEIFVHTADEARATAIINKGSQV
ncbi:MAG TPA: hypothetical protein VJT54_11315 [Verrucomicrobiae bacterium]|nr:hypothetical protein [Verrucomicrobiae bacterium]